MLAFAGDFTRVYLDVTQIPIGTVDFAKIKVAYLHVNHGYNLSPFQISTKSVQYLVVARKSNKHTHIHQRWFLFSSVYLL